MKWEITVNGRDTVHEDVRCVTVPVWPCAHGIRKNISVTYHTMSLKNKITCTAVIHK